MKPLLLSLSLAVAAGGFAFAPADADARRLGGGRAAGMQRTLPPKPAEATKAPAQQAPAPTNAQTNPAPAATAAAPAAATAAAAAPARRSWMAPVAGLAAGLGLAALASHFGFGEALANAMTIALLAIVGIVLVRWLLRRFAGGTAAPAGTRMGYAGAGAGNAAPRGEPAMARSAWPSTSPAIASPSAAAAPMMAAADDGFDAAGFERVAKTIFIRLQTANDAGELDDLRRFTTSELYASLRLDLQERAGKSQQTDVLKLDAEIVDRAVEDGRQVVTVRFHGLIREERDGSVEPFDELWHLVKPQDGSREWAIAGIQQHATA